MSEPTTYVAVPKLTWESVLANAKLRAWEYDDDLDYAERVRAVVREVQPDTLTRDDAELVAREWLRLRRMDIGQRPLGPKDLADLILGTRAAYEVHHG